MNCGTGGGGTTKAGRGAEGTTTGNADDPAGITGMGGAATDVGGADTAQRHGSPRWHPQVQYG